MSNDFDTACRRRVKREPAAFLAWLFTDFDAIARHVGWVDTRRLPFPGKADQTGDLVFEVELLQAVQALWALALEFQVEPDPDMLGRMLIYLGTLWLERHPDPLRGSRYQLAAAVVNLTGTSQAMPASASFVWPGSDGMACVLKVRERYLAEESAEDTLEAIAQGRYDRALLPWVPLMHGGSDPAVIARWLDLASAEPDERKRAELGYDGLVFADKSADPEAWGKALEGWAVVKSPTMEKTRQEGRVEVLLRILRTRGKQEVPTDLADKIRACTDEVQLFAWIDVAAVAATLDEFRQQTGL